MHLVTRFFQVAMAKPLSAAEQTDVARLLQPGEEALFWSQQPADQRHALRAARSIQTAGGNDLVTRAALLHDVGKASSHLGSIGRTIATLLGGLRLPMTRRMRQYRDHGSVGADALAGLGAERLVVDYTRCHHATRPQSIDAATWELLQRADRQ